MRAKIEEFQEKANGKEKGDMQEDKESNEEVKGVEEGGEEGGEGEKVRAQREERSRSKRKA